MAAGSGGGAVAFAGMGHRAGDLTVAVCTIVTRSHAPRARVLAESLTRHHPDLRLVVLVTDQEVLPLDARSEPFDVVGPYDIGLDVGEFHRLATIYDAQRLCVSLEPRLLQYLLSTGVDVAMFFDSDVQIFAPLDELFDVAASRSVLLTPHITEPLPRDGQYPNELDLLPDGVFNSGLVAVGVGGAAFLEWWGSHLKRHWVRTSHLFADQRWLDYVPCMFEHEICRDPGCNVAWWNLGPRRIERHRDGYRVNGSPLRFFHFAGFDPEQPHLLYDYDWNPSVPQRARVASHHPEVPDLCRHYAERLIALGCLEEEKIAYPFARAANGLPLDARIRELYRLALLDGSSELPDPFTATGAEQLVEWLRAPVSGSGRVSRYLKQLYDEHQDFQAAFPDLAGNDGVRYLEWIGSDGRSLLPIPNELLPDDTEPVQAVTRTPPRSRVGARARWRIWRHARRNGK